MAKHDRRRQIIQAAEKLFTSRRFHEVTTDDVAREAKVGKGTIYRYFEDKDELFLETANFGFDGLCEALTNEVPENAPFAEQLSSACVQISDFLEHKHRLLRLMQSGDQAAPFVKGKFRERFIANRTRLIAALAAIIRRGVAEGRIRDDIAPEALSSFLLGMLRTRGRDLEDLPEADRRHELVLELFENGASPRGEPASLQGDMGK